MLISIITATYNSASSVATAMMSIASQTYLEVEVVVIDGGSIDETVTVVESFYTRNLKLVSEKDNGIYDALNKGIKISNGDIIGYVHSDDFLASPTILAEIAKVFWEEGVDGVYGDLLYVNKDNTNQIVRFWKSESFHADLLRKGWMPAHPTLFLKKEVYEKHGLFNLDYQIAADYDFMLRILKDPSLKFKYIPKVITKMRVGGASNRSLKNIKLKSSEDLRALKSNGIKKPYLALAWKNLSKLEQFFVKH